MQPTLAGFLSFVRQTMAIPADILPDNSPVIAMAFAIALAIVNPALRIIPIPSQDSASVTLNAGGLSIYALAVYNLAASNLLQYAQDLPDAPLVHGSGGPNGNPPGLPFFAWTRQRLNINGFVSGVVQSTSDEGSSTSLVVQDAAKDFTIANLAQLKDIYGRTYLALAQSAGPTTWGLS